MEGMKQLETTSVLAIALREKLMTMKKLVSNQPLASHKAEFRITTSTILKCVILEVINYHLSKIELEPLLNRCLQTN